MKRRILLDVARVLVGAAVLSCVGSDRVVAPNSDGTAAGVPAAGRMSTLVPTPGPLGTTHPVAGSLSMRWPGTEESLVLPDAATSLAAATSGRLLWQKPTTREHSIWLLNGT